jgi:hypothetical protein
MTAARGEYMRKLGCLRLQLQHLDQSLRTNNLSEMETISRSVEDLLLDLVKGQRKLSREDHAALRPRFAALREDALHSLEVARRILDDSLEAMLLLVKTVQDATGNSVGHSGSSFMIDRKA